METPSYPAGLPAATKAALITFDSPGQQC